MEGPPLGSPLLRRRNHALAVLGAAGLIAGLATVGPATAAPATADGTTATYLVQLSDAPAASYAGGLAGYAATRPAAGAKLDAAAPAVAAYRGYLRQRQDGVLRQAGSARKLYDYSVAFNGFSARMTAADAAKLAGTAGVLAVTKDERRTIDTTRTPEFLGLTKPGGIWAQLGGPGSRGAGSGVVVGVVDSGAWPESPSLAPLANPRPISFAGTCQTGEQWTAANCTSKIVGARYYTAGATAGVGDIKTVFPYEYLVAAGRRQPRHPHLDHRGRQLRRRRRRSTASTSARPAAWRRTPGWRPTRSAGAVTRPRPAATPATASRRSRTPPPTAST